MLNDDRADWREAYALFPGDVAYVWHGALHGDVVGGDLTAPDAEATARGHVQEDPAALHSGLGPKG